MPLYVADYLADTGHLSAAEHGAYLMLIMHYWRQGSLPVEDRTLQRISRMTGREWEKSRATIAAFFDADWRHGRIENELAKCQLKSNARADSGKRGGLAKALKTKEAAIANATVLPEQILAKGVASSSQPQPHPEREGSSLRSESRARERDAFAKFWTAWPNKVGKPVAEKSFQKVAAEIEAILAGVDRYIRNKPPYQSWLNPATFLNQRRWEDSPATSQPKGSGQNGKRTIFDVLDCAESRLADMPDRRGDEMRQGTVLRLSGSRF
jgi:uncharacterized protein YdaU (DUF1376 family)